MAYENLTCYGYGICTSELTKEIEIDRLLGLIKTAPALHKKITRFFADSGSLENIETYDILTVYVETCGDYNSGGLAEILREVIMETEKIDLMVCEDYESETYLLFEPRYPWSESTEEEKNLTEEKLNEIFRKYLRIVTDEKFEVGYLKVENGC